MLDLFYLCYAVSPSPGGAVIIPGPLPAPGGVLGQDNATMEAFRVITSELLSLSAEQTKKKKPGAK